MNFRQTLKDLIAHGFSFVLIKKLSDLLCDPRYFHLWEKKGIHITPNYFDQPIPDTRTLKDSLWSKKSQMVGIDMNERVQMKFLQEICPKYKEEYDKFPLYEAEKPCQYYVYNGKFGEVDGDIYYCMIRYYKPKRIFEIGAGYSTYLAAQACLKNRSESGRTTDLIAIEPYPNSCLRHGFPGLSKLIQKKVEEIDLGFFDKLEENDILFIDSTHVAKINSDVCYEYLELLPRLNKGVIVHSHDIFLPAEYPKDWVLKKYRFWNEAYLLQAFLEFNTAFEVLWAGNYMKLNHPDKMKSMFRSYASQSFWIRKKYET